MFFDKVTLSGYYSYQASIFSWLFGIDCFSGGVFFIRENALGKKRLGFDLEQIYIDVFNMFQEWISKNFNTKFEIRVSDKRIRHNFWCGLKTALQEKGPNLNLKKWSLRLALTKQIIPLAVENLFEVFDFILLLTDRLHNSYICGNCTACWD